MSLTRLSSPKRISASTISAVGGTYGLNADALDWRSRVTDNFGTVSTSTFYAVVNFCNAINAAGLRDRFYRLNLFCGVQLNAALVPLYRNTSPAGSVLGNSTDTNNNFVSGDYSLTSGLTGNATTKYLDTGVLISGVSASDGHLGVGLLATDTNSQSYRTIIGGYDSVSQRSLEIYARRSDQSSRCFACGAVTTVNASAGDFVQSAALATGNIVGSYPNAYRNGSAFGTAATQSNTVSNVTQKIFVYAQASSSNTPGVYTNARLGWYSIGAGLSSSQASSFHTAINDFYTAIGRL